MVSSNRILSAVTVGKSKAKPGTTTSAYMVLLVVMTCDAFSSSLARLTMDNGMSGLAIAALRLPMAWLVFTPMVLRGHLDELRGMAWRDRLLMVVAGVLFTGQILLVFFAIDNTAILVVHVTFSTGLLWVATLERVLLKATLSRVVLVGLALAFTGSIIIGAAGASGDDTASSSAERATVLQQDNSNQQKTPTLGLVAGLIASMAGAVYLIIGRSVRERVSSTLYIWGVFGTGGLVSLIILGVTGTPLAGYDTSAYLYLLLLLVVVQFGLHGGINYVVGYLRATIVSISGQMGMVTASMVAFFVFGEVPELLEVAGGVVIVTGVMVALFGQRNNQNKLNQPES